MDFIGHYLIAALVGLGVFGKQDWKKILAFSLFAILPDLDFAFGLHRMLFHNVFFAVIIGLLVFAVLKKFKVEKALKYGAFAFLGVFSHLLLDLGKPGLALLYPVFQKGVYFEFYLSIYFSQIKPYIEFGIVDLQAITTGFCCQVERTFLSDATTAILTVVVLALLVHSSLPAPCNLNC